MVRGEQLKQVIQDLFGYISEEEVKSQSELYCPSNSTNNQEDGGPRPEGNVPSEGERKEKSQSKGELQDVEHIHGASKLTSPCSQLVCIGDQRECEGRKKNGNRNRNHQNLHVAAALREVFGDSDDEEQAECTIENHIDNEETVSRPGADKESNYKKELGPETENSENKPKEKAAVPLLVVSTLHPPADPDNMYLVRLPNMVGIDPRPFDPSTYVVQDLFATEKSGSRRLVPFKNIIRWRHVKNPNGTTSVESNARFVSWSDGSVQLYIGEESFSVSELDARDMEMHLFLKTKEGILQSQGRITKRMQLMPSSITSDSHCTLSALVDARNKKVSKVKYCIADVDPEREIQYKEKVLKHPTKSAIPTVGSSQWPIPLSGCKRRDFRYKRIRKEYEGSSSQRRYEDTKQNLEQGHDEEQEEEACEDSEVEAEETKQKVIDSDEEYLSGKATTPRQKTIKHRRKTTVYVSDEE